MYRTTNNICLIFWIMYNFPRHRRYAAQGFRVVAISTKTSGLRPSKKTQIGFVVACRAA